MYYALRDHRLLFTPRRRFGPRTKVEGREAARHGGHVVPAPLLPHTSTEQPGHPVHSGGPSPAFTTSSYPERAGVPQTPRQARPGYIGDQSLMAYPSDSEPSYSPQPEGLSVDTAEMILQITRAASVPPRPLAKALVDFYYEELFHILPVVERHEIDTPEPSLLLLQSLYFAGSLMRRSMGPSTSFSPEENYGKLKTLLFLNHEKDKMVILKALCMLGCWSSSPPRTVSLDCPWHWTGMAIRLALQIGLHRESTYVNQLEGVHSRRIWWSLFVSICEYFEMTVPDQHRTMILYSLCATAVHP